MVCRQVHDSRGPGARRRAQRPNQETRIGRGWVNCRGRRRSSQSVVRITKENKPRRRPETVDNHIVKNCIKRRLQYTIDLSFEASVVCLLVIVFYMPQRSEDICLRQGTTIVQIR
jgi:hypothetical protein